MKPSPLSNHKDFITKVLTLLKEKGINTSKLTIDHLGYQADSARDFEEKTDLIKKDASLLSQNIVGGRRVAIYKLGNPFIFEDQEINIVEIFEPREGQQVASAFEHIEFLTPVSLEDFVEEYSNIEWDKSVMNRAEFPMLILKLQNGIRAKFPRLSVIKEIQRQRNI